MLSLVNPRPCAPPSLAIRSPYPSLLAGCRGSKANPDGTVAYLAGYLYTLRCMRDSANREEVIEQLAKASDPESARQVYERSIAEGTLARDPRFDVEAFKNVLALRAEIEGTWGGKPPSPERYYDLSYFQKALALLDK
jgi:hypothetical protein